MSFWNHCTENHMTTWCNNLAVATFIRGCCHSSRYVNHKYDEAGKQTHNHNIHTAAILISLARDE